MSMAAESGMPEIAISCQIQRWEISLVWLYSGATSG